MAEFIEVRKMDRLELLESYYEAEMNNLFFASAGYKMDYPKKGCERAWKQAKEKADKVKDNIAASTKGIAAGLEGGIKQSWKNFRCPEMPPGV